MAETYVADSPAIALTAGTAKSTLVLSASSSQPFRLIDMLVSCDATSTGLLKVELLAATLSGGTTSTAPNVARMNGESMNKAPLITASSYSAEPTYTKLSNNSAVAIRTWITPLPVGPFEIQYPLGREFYTTESDVCAIRLTSTTVSPNAYTSICWEE